MNTFIKALNMFILSIIIMATMITVLLSFMLGIGHPLPWLLLFVLIAIPFFHNKIISARRLRWHDSMSTGIELIDNDHKKLIELINIFQEATEYLIEENTIQSALDDLINYTKYHFSREEYLLQQNHYPSYSAHQEQHQKMIAKISQLSDEYTRDKTMALDHTVTFLKKWLKHHILHSDKDYVPFLKNSDLSGYIEGSQ